MSWKKVRVSELGRVVTGKTPPTKQRNYYDGDFPFITPSDLDYDTYRIQTTATFLSDEARAEYHNQFIDENTVAFTCIASVGKIGIAIRESLTNQQINSIIVNDEHDYRFVYYLLRNESFRIQRMCSGVATPIINKSDFEKVELRVPESLVVEQNIASILASYDDLIENNQRRIAFLEQAARLLYKEWFVHLRFPGHEHTPIINGIPEGWERKRLGEIATIMKGKNITQEMTEDGNVPVVAGGLKPAYYHNTANALGPVITVSASGANAGYVALYHQDIWASDCSYLSSSDNPEIWFLYLAMKSSQAEITGMQQGSAQPHVYPKHLKRLCLQNPPKTLRKHFHETVESSFLQIENLEKQIVKLARARDLLLPKLMNGEVAV